MLKSSSHRPLSRIDGKENKRMADQEDQPPELSELRLDEAKRGPA
jgi:hypothetical protein